MTTSDRLRLEVTTVLPPIVVRPISEAFFKSLPAAEAASSPASDSLSSDSFSGSKLALLNRLRRPASNPGSRWEDRTN